MSNKTHSSNHDEMMSEHHHNHEIMDMEHENHEMHNMHNMDNMHDMDNMDMMNHGGHMMHMGDMSKSSKWLSFLWFRFYSFHQSRALLSLNCPEVKFCNLSLVQLSSFTLGLLFSGAKGELKSRKPAMMMLITMGITVAYAYSVYATIMSFNGHMGMNFWFELATLIVIMLIGHLIEMKAIMGAGDALKDLASLVPKKLT